MINYIHTAITAVHSNTTLVKVNQVIQKGLFKEMLYSNTTLVKVNRKSYGNYSRRIRIQIQLLLRLICYGVTKNGSCDRFKYNSC